MLPIELINLISEFTFIKESIIIYKLLFPKKYLSLKIISKYMTKFAKFNDNNYIYNKYYFSRWWVRKYNNNKRINNYHLWYWNKWRIRNYFICVIKKNNCDTSCKICSKFLSLSTHHKIARYVRDVSLHLKIKPMKYY